MFMVGVELVKFAKDVRLDKNIAPFGVVVALSLATNMAYGFVAGVVSYYLIRAIFNRKHNQKT